VTRPKVIVKETDEGILEPYEELTIDVDEQYSGTVIENLGKRKGQMVHMHQDKGIVRLSYRIPTRGLIGFRSQFLTETKGTGTMNYIFDGYDRHAGEMKNRNNGVLVVMEVMHHRGICPFQPSGKRRAFSRSRRKGLRRSDNR